MKYGKITFKISAGNETYRLDGNFLSKEVSNILHQNLELGYTPTINPEYDSSVFRPQHLELKTPITYSNIHAEIAENITDEILNLVQNEIQKIKALERIKASNKN